VDHIDNDALNNCRGNLRLATKQQNNMNRSKRKEAKYKGIYKINRPKPWAANLSYNNKTIYIGSFKTDIEAAKAYDEAAKKYYGKYACLNFPEKKYRGLKELFSRRTNKK
jgi:hypothetical protein